MLQYFLIIATTDDNKGYDITNKFADIPEYHKPRNPH
jgi:hypothetical protein